MSLESLAYLVFFLVYGVSHFFPFRHCRDITAIAAIVIGVMMVLN